MAVVPRMLGREAGGAGRADAVRWAGVDRFAPDSGPNSAPSARPRPAVWRAESMKFVVFGAAFAAVVLWANPAAAELVGEDAAACRAGQGPAVLADIVGLKDRRSEIRFELYPANQEDFLRADYELIQQGKVFRRVRSAPP